MGFGKDTWYHGSFDNINKFDPKPVQGTSPYLGKGTYLSTSPADASSYATTDNVDTQYKIEKLAETIRDRFDKGHTEALEGASNRVTKGLDSGAVYPVRFRTGKAEPEYVEGSPSFEDAQRLVAKKDVAFMQPLEKWPHMDNLTPDDWHVRIKDPSKIRSTNAAFDPRFKDSSLLLAGTAGVAATGAALGGQQAEASPVSAAKKIAYKVAHKDGELALKSKVAKAGADFRDMDTVELMDPEMVPHLDKIGAENPVYIPYLEADKGYGSKALKVLEQSAKKRGADAAYLNASPMNGTRGLSQEEAASKLKEFYAKNGYQVAEDQGTNAMMYKKLAAAGLIGAAGSGKVIDDPSEIATQAYEGYDKYVQQPVSGAAKFITDRIIGQSTPDARVAQQVSESPAAGLAEFALEGAADPLNFAAAPLAAAGVLAKAGRGPKVLANLAKRSQEAKKVRATELVSEYLSTPSGQSLVESALKGAK